MAESDLHYFRLALQEMNARLQPKMKPDRQKVIQQQPTPTCASLVAIPATDPGLPAVSAVQLDRRIEHKSTVESSVSVVLPRITGLPATYSEDYTGAVCLLHQLTELFPTYHEVLVDADDLDRLAAHKWRLVRTGSSKSLRVMNSNGRYLHAVVADSPRGKVVDHIYHSPLDNRKSRLRICTVRENNCNRQPRAGKGSKFKGVQKNKRTGKWFVLAGPRDGRVFIGGFDSEIDAALAYNALAKSLYGAMAYQNRIEPSC
ncbi:AP2 domain-containing protein [Gemmata sp. JC717]|uniref:AP2 domain-containing protein n=1 Tax=Gemmata algarum TaxID=2975278 RepID=UPI0021BB59FA|nr:AP2 domain-containing protein [Gemmata algarum]MDY3551443.1 AP2 domain-containing protein [Gemmata algarum]